MKHYRLLASAAVLALATAGAVRAQDRSHFLDRMNAEPVGEVAGQPAYRVPGFDETWIVMQDGSVIAGHGFDAAGNDITSSLTGLSPMSAWETYAVQMQMNRDEGAASTSAGTLPSGTLPSGTLPAGTLPAGHSPSGLAPSGSAGPGEVSTINASVLPEGQAAQTEQPLPAELIADAALEGYSEEDKINLAAELVMALDETTNPLSYRLALLEWTERVTRTKMLDEETRAELQAQAAALDEVMAQRKSMPGASDQASPPPTAEPLPGFPKGPARLPEESPESALLPGPPDQGGGTVLLPARESAAQGGGTVLLPAREPAAQEGIALPPVSLAPNIGPGADSGSDFVIDDLEVSLQAGPADERSDARIFMDEVQEETFWLELGKAEAPVVYMFADPLCPHSARAFHNLQGAVEGGALRIRAILAPVVSPNSGQYIAGVLNAENPAEAFWEHVQQYARTGASSVAPADFSTLPQDLNDKIRANRDLIVRRQMKGVPFFAWEAEAGPKFLSGVPHPDYFNSLPR